jgi:hypothetical protein
VVANTTGVSSTTVASRLNTAVTSEATTNTEVSSRFGRPRAMCAITVPHQVNRPSWAHSWARISTAAKNPTTGASSVNSLRASVDEITPTPTRIEATGTATTASDHPKGRIAAHANTATNPTTEHISASAMPTTAFPNYLMGDCAKLISRPAHVTPCEGVLVAGTERYSTRVIGAAIDSAPGTANSVRQPNSWAMCPADKGLTAAPMLCGVSTALRAMPIWQACSGSDDRGAHTGDDDGGPLVLSGID